MISFILYVSFLNSDFVLGNGKLTRKKSKHHLKETGAVYTLKQITNEIVDNTIQKAIQEKQIGSMVAAHCVCYLFYRNFC